MKWIELIPTNKLPEKRKDIKARKIVDVSYGVVNGWIVQKNKLIITSYKTKTFNINYNMGMQSIFI